MMKKSRSNIQFEDSLTDVWSTDLGIREVPLGDRSLRWVGFLIGLLGLIVALRTVYIVVAQGDLYKKRAFLNLSQAEKLPAPRGLIVDRYGKVLADNKPVFSAVLNMKNYIHMKERQDESLNSAERILGIPRNDIMQMIEDRNGASNYDPLVLSPDIAQDKVVQLTALDSQILQVERSFERNYSLGPATAQLLGYVGLPTPKDLSNNPDLMGDDLVGRSGVESYYDDMLHGIPGALIKMRDSKGRELGDEQQRNPVSGKPLSLTIDSDLQQFFFQRLSQRLADLGRNAGVGIAMNPKTGEVLAMVSFPSYESNIFSSSGHNDEKRALLTSPLHPMFNRAIGGVYSPGSTIKPLHAVAALAEGTINSQTTVYSPGYFTIPNPYNPDKPTIIPDEHRAGVIDLNSAIARSSNTYFFSVGGGANGIQGLGINRLHSWWDKFELGKDTGIDLPGEAEGLLPNLDWKLKTAGRQWMLGDTYNVSIGQGDLLTSPIQLLNYISTIANGGSVMRPFVNSASTPKVVSDLTKYKDQIGLVQDAMVQTTKNPLGTAYSLHDLVFDAAAKTGTAQALNNSQNNALFVGFAPAKDAQIAVLVLIENSRDGSANTIPVAKDVLKWYYDNRINKN